MTKYFTDRPHRRYTEPLDTVIRGETHRDDFSGTHFEAHRIGIVSTQRKPAETLGIGAPLAQLQSHLDASAKLETLIERTAQLLGQIGIVDFGHIKLTKKVDALDVIGTYPKESLDRFRREAFHQADLVLEALLCGRSALFRSEVDDHVLNANFQIDAYIHHKAYCGYLHAQGIHEVYCYPIPDSDPPALFFCSTPEMDKKCFQEIVSAHLPSIQNLAKAFHRAGSERFETYFHNARGNDNIPLRDRPLQLLETLAQKDVTLNEAALILDISISTANQHIALAKKKLRASTTHGLLIAAHKEGLLLF